jgi:RimJ/RimL family protein N-acetyltransferase
VIPFPDPPLNDGAITLRPLREADAPALAATYRDDETRRWTWWLASGEGPFDVSETTIEIAEREERRRLGHAITLAIAGGTVSEFLGTVSLAICSDGLVGEVGFIVCREARGRHVARRAGRLVVDWGFEGLGLRRIQAVTASGNHRARTVLECLGFQQEGLLRSYRPGSGASGDRLIYSLLPSDGPGSPAYR